MLTDNDIARITQRIVQSTSPLAVGAFGSYGIGTAHDGSDLDLFVIRETRETREARARAIRRLLFGILNPLDVHVFTPAEFEEAAHEYQSFPWVIARQARMFYWTEEAVRAVPSLLPRVNAVKASTLTIA
jgi:predicted nucleotidyltransferase